MRNSTGKSRSHVLTIALEDYYQVGAFERVIPRGHWPRFERRVARGTRLALDFLSEFGHRATFFVSGHVAEQMPELVRELAERGHEVASLGMTHREIGRLTPAEFRADLERSREVIEAATGRSVLGYRVPRGWFGPKDLWALDLLAASGYRYDSSVAPLLRRFVGEPWRRFVHPHRIGEQIVWEYPISSVDLFGWVVPIGGGNYVRQLPERFIERALAGWVERHDSPLVLYFHTWELDPGLPRVTAAPWLQRVRTYRNLDAMPGRLSRLLGRYRLTSIADHLGIEPAAVAQPAPALSAPLPVPAVVASGEPRVPITVVVPCHDEAGTLPYLANTLRSVVRRLEPRYDVKLLFVDDGSGDATWSVLQDLFGGWGSATLVRHPTNRGLTQALRTGFEHAETEIICSIDADCTYDPAQLEQMVPLLTADTALVTASPYHPSGVVRGVPWWRLALSRCASALYRLALGQSVRTYTSCFRVYRKSAVLPHRIESEGFLGVAELLGRVILAGGKVGEYPAVLEARLLGVSKMRVLRTIAGHLRLLGRIVGARFLGVGPLVTKREWSAATP